MSLNEITEYVKINLGIPNVKLDGIDLLILRAYVDALEDMLNKYPALRGSIITFGDQELITNQMITILETEDEQTKEEVLSFLDSEFNSTSSMFMFLFVAADERIYTAICLTNLLKQINLKTLNLMLNEYSNCGKIIKNANPKTDIYHEFAHLLDFLYEISSSNEFQIILVGHNIEKEISAYAAESNQETFAEAWAAYHGPGEASGLIKEIGEYFEQFYQAKFKQSLI